MPDNGTKRRIDNARQVLVGKVPDPKAQVEQITTALIYKFMDDMDQESILLGGKASFFIGDYQQYAWPKIMDKSNSGYERWRLYSEAITKMSQNANLPQLFRNIFKDAYLPYNDPETLNLFLKEIDGFTYDHSEKLGDAFEYLLSVLGSQGAAGQFRTPRHIIDFIVEVVNPGKTDTILDPACGTAGFLISAYKHILAENADTPLTPDEMQRLTRNIVGYDISPDMVRLSLVNMYLHQFQDPTIVEYDTLTSEERWEDSFDVILANPPFMSPSGGIRPHSRFSVQANRSEVLFVDYIAEHLHPEGRAGIIVPEGIIFQSSNAYKALRKMLVEENYLYAVVSLPAGVFNPYSGVKTSILLMDKTIARQTKNILFINIENDGLSLGAQRTEIDANDFPEALKIIRDFQKNPNTEAEDSLFSIMVSKSRIADNGDYNLSGNRYQAVLNSDNIKWPLVELESVFLEITNGVNVRQINENGKYRVSRIATISQGVVDLKATKWTNDEVKEKYFLRQGDILLSHINSIEHLGKSAIFTSSEKVVHGINLIRFRPNQELLNSKYAIYIFKSNTFIRIVKKYAQKAVNQASVKVSDLKNIKIPLPLMEVQQAIAEEIEGYQKIVDGARQVVENYKPVIKIDPEWPLVELEKLISYTRGVTYSKSDEVVEKGNVVLRANNIDLQSNSLDLSDLKRVRHDFNFKEERRLRKNDILICSASGSKEHIGKVAFIHSDLSYYAGGFMAILRTEKCVLPKYLFYHLGSRNFRDHIEKNTVGANIRNLKPSLINDLLIPIPSISIQKEIVAQIDEEQQLIESNKRLIEIFEKKIEAKIAEVWGEPGKDTPSGAGAPPPPICDEAAN